MARVTVEDCITKVANRFELVMLASQRARKIGSGAPLQVERDNDKNTVVSLREMAEDKITPADMKEELIKNNQRVIEMDDSEDVIDMMDGEEEWNTLTDNSAAPAVYEDIDESEESNDEPSLEDLAGGAPEGHESF